MPLRRAAAVTEITPAAEIVDEMVFTAVQATPHPRIRRAACVACYASHAASCARHVASAHVACSDVASLGGARRVLYPASSGLRAAIHLAGGVVHVVAFHVVLKNYFAAQNTPERTWQVLRRNAGLIAKL
jgi:hypothetical protein